MTWLGLVYAATWKRTGFAFANTKPFRQ
jgi:hypothetical protein